MSILRVEVPRALKPLLQPARYKGAYGGRGGAKSHFFAEQLIVRCFSEPTRAVCIREVQNSLKESVRQLLIDKIAKFDLGGSFDVQEAEIRGPNGSLIIFRGMQAYNAANIKSLEGYDIAWVEEAQTLSAVSLRMLRPTIRKAGSELWFSWNPRHDDDAVDAFLRGPHRPKDAIVVPVGWQDNPWLPTELLAEMRQDYAADPEMAEHVWGGGYEIVSEGSYYARLLAEAEREGRIGDFPHVHGRPVRTSWDIGVDDYSAVWFIQDDGVRPTVIDYYEASGEGAEDIVRACLPELIPDTHEAARQIVTIGRHVPWRYAEHFLPHDVRNREWGGGGRSRVQVLQGLGVKPIRVGAAQGPEERISAVRKLLPLCRFNDTPSVRHGIKRLQRYSRKFNEAMQTFGGPLHDENSHGADAFGEYAVNCGLLGEAPVKIAMPKPKPGQVMLPGPPAPPSGVRIRI